MTARQQGSAEVALVALDVVKSGDTVLMKASDGRHQRFRVASSRSDHGRLVQWLNESG